MTTNRRPRMRLPRIRLPHLRRPRASLPRPHRPRRAHGALAGWRLLALVAIAVLVAAASAASFMESYRALYDWAHVHGLSVRWSAIWPLQIDTFIAVGELALFVALIDGWQRRARALPWVVVLAGLAVSVAGNVGHVGWAAPVTYKATAAVPPLAAAAALAVGLGVLKRVTENRPAVVTDENVHLSVHGQALAVADADQVAASAYEAASVALARSVAGGNPLSGRALERQFRLTRAEATKVRQTVTAVKVTQNGHTPEGK
jgi:Protein of unknown function (DUF2637)